MLLKSQTNLSRPSLQVYTVYSFMLPSILLATFRLRGILSPSHRIDGVSLLINPTLARLAPPLQDHGVALHSARKIIPRHSHHVVLALEVRILFLQRNLPSQSQWVEQNQSAR